MFHTLLVGFGNSVVYDHYVENVLLHHQRFRAALVNGFLKCFDLGSSKIILLPHGKDINGILTQLIAPNNNIKCWRSIAPILCTKSYWVRDSILVQCGTFETCSYVAYIYAISLGPGCIIFLGLRSVRASADYSLARWPTDCRPTGKLYVRPLVPPERSPQGITLRTHGRNGMTFGLPMYVNQLQKWFDFGHGLLIFLIVVQLRLSEMGYIWGFPSIFWVTRVKNDPK